MYNRSKSLSQVKAKAKTSEVVVFGLHLITYVYGYWPDNNFFVKLYLTEMILPKIIREFKKCNKITQN